MEEERPWWKEIANDRLMETIWERQMNLAGMDAYEKSRRSDASDTTAGQKLLREMVMTAAKAVEDMQKKILGINRVERNLRGTVLLIPAETASLIALRRMIDATYGAIVVDDGTNYQILCKEVAKRIEPELNFRHWVNSSQQAAKEYAKANGLAKTPKSIADRMIEESGVSRASYFRWKNTFEELNTYKWDNLEQHYCGEALVLTIAEALPEHFTVQNLYRRGKTIKHVKMTDETRQRIDDIEATVLQNKVYKKPMLVKPRPWTREE